MNVHRNPSNSTVCPGLLVPIVVSARSLYNAKREASSRTFLAFLSLTSTLNRRPIWENPMQVRSRNTPMKHHQAARQSHCKRWFGRSYSTANERIHSHRWESSRVAIAATVAVVKIDQENVRIERENMPIWNHRESPFDSVDRPHERRSMCVWNLPMGEKIESVVAQVYSLACRWIVTSVPVYMEWSFDRIVWSIDECLNILFFVERPDPDEPVFEESWSLAFSLSSFLYQRFWRARSRFSRSSPGAILSTKKGNDWFSKNPVRVFRTCVIV